MDPGELSFFLAVLVEGILAGAIYALIALAFVLVYKCARMVNFAVGEWVMASALAATGIVSVAAGILWVLVAGGGFGVALVGLKVFPIIVIGGLDSIPGTIVAAMLIGMVESLGSGYLDPLFGGGFGTVASYLLLFAMLVARPNGLFGRPPAKRV